MATISARRKTSSGRFYEIKEGQPYISITNALESISKPALIGWSAKVEREACIAAAVQMAYDGIDTITTSSEAYTAALTARIGKQKASTKLLNAAGEIGTGTHSLIEWYIRKELKLDVGPRPKVDDKCEWGYMAFEDWVKAHDFKPTHSEMVVFSHIHKYAGTLDITGTVDGETALIDIKTGKAIYAEAKCQCAAYIEALGEMGLGRPIRCIILRLPKVETDPEFEAIEVGKLSEHFETFLHAKALRLWQIEEEKQYKAKLEASNE